MAHLDGGDLGQSQDVYRRHAGIGAGRALRQVLTHDQDVFVNVVGGIRVTETGADLAVTLAVVSSLRGRPLPADMVVFEGYKDKGDAHL